MARKQIFSVGFNFPGNAVESVSFTSDRSLLDADVIVFRPSLDVFDISERYNGQPVLTKSSSFRARQQLPHWKCELNAALDAGKLVIVFLAKPQEYFAHTGEKQFSGTGRNRQTTLLVGPIGSYSALPTALLVRAHSGRGIKPAGDLGILAAYWNEFASDSTYEATLDGEFSKVFLQTQSGNRVVGALHRQGAGSVLFLPPIQFDEESFTTCDEEGDEEYWTEEATQFGKRLATTIANLADAIANDSAVTPPPLWTQGSEFRLPQEDAIEDKLRKKVAQIEQANEAKRKLESTLVNAGSLRRLLFEKGKPLEAAIIEALTLLGFSAEPFDDGESEFDAVFVAAEGRFLGEAEGKDRRPINIDKLSQLERNIQEDFARDDVSEYAIGVLFGNSHRFDPPAERPDTFTTKCFSGAERSGIVLIRTSDLFEPARYLQSNKNAQFAKKCREAIVSSKGHMATLPAPPDSDTRKSKQVIEESSTASASD